MSISKAIDAFNSLIVINNDRMLAYRTAANETNELDLSNFFLELSLTSATCKNELVAEVKRLGGIPIEENKDLVKPSVWMTIRPSIVETDLNVIASFCEFGENATLDAYKNVLIQEVHEFKSNEQDILNNHYALLKNDYEKLKQIHNVLKSEHNNN